MKKNNLMTIGIVIVSMWVLSPKMLGSYLLAEIKQTERTSSIEYAYYKTVNSEVGFCFISNDNNTVQISGKDMLSRKNKSRGRYFKVYWQAASNGCEKFFNEIEIVNVEFHKFQGIENKNVEEDMLIYSTGKTNNLSYAIVGKSLDKNTIKIRFLEKVDAKNWLFVMMPFAVLLDAMSMPVQWVMLFTYSG